MIGGPHYIRKTFYVLQMFDTFFLSCVQMDKIREVSTAKEKKLPVLIYNQKIASIRAEADAANEKAENYYKTIKELENQLLTKEQDIVSLTHRNGQLENELERAQEKIAQLKVIEEDEDGLKKVNDAAQRKIALLEQELESSENLYREATQK